MIYLQFPLSEGIFISFFSILIVFFILSTISISIMSLKYMHQKPAPIKVTTKAVKPFSISDIKDDDMMVAAITASIDYQEVTQTDVRVISIKEIKV